MYNLLVSHPLTVSTTLADVYTCAGDTSIVVGLSLVNNLVTDIVVSVNLYTAVGALTTDIIPPNTLIAAGESFVPVGGVQKLTMNSGDKIQAICDTLVGLDAICSAMEFTNAA